MVIPGITLIESIFDFKYFWIDTCPHDLKSTNSKKNDDIQSRDIVLKAANYESSENRI